MVYDGLELNSRLGTEILMRHDDTPNGPVIAIEILRGLTKQIVMHLDVVLIGTKSIDLHDNAIRMFVSSDHFKSH